MNPGANHTKNRNPIPAFHLNTNKKALSGLAIDISVCNGAHLWRDRTFGEDLTCFSDELVAEIKNAGLRMPKMYQLTEI